MKYLLRYQYSLYLFLLITLSATGAALSFSTHWSTHFDGGSSDLNQWSSYKIGSCSGQNHSVSGSQVHMSASYGTNCFGAYYRENNSSPGAFPLDVDVRVMWRWRYPKYELFGTEAGQVTSAYGVVQYYGISGVDTRQAGGDTRDAHVLTDGEWGRNTVENPLWQTADSDHNLHTATFDFICDGRELTWWADAQQVKRLTNGTPRPANDPYRPYQFWFGNLLTSTPSDGGWSSFDLDYVYIYRVERPQMNPPAPGGGGTQPVSWNAVATTPQPDGASWSIEYQVQACSNSTCSTPVATSGWQSGTSYTFSGLPLQQTYYYRARARWAGTPELITCWGSTVSALMAGEADITLSKNATTQVLAGGTVKYSLVLRSSGDIPAGGVVVNDPIPQYVTNPTGISGGSVQGSQIVWNLGTVANGQSATLTWQGTIDPNLPTSASQVINTASASDNAGHSAQAQATTAVLKPVMDLGKTASAQVWPGGPVLYTITLKSLGNTALTNLVVRDPLPEVVGTPGAISSGGSVQNGTIIWNLGSLPAGQTLTLTWQGTVAAVVPRSQARIVNTASASADGGLSKQAQAESEIKFPEIGLAKSGPAEAAAGSVIEYAIAVHNIGDGPAENVVIHDPLPAYLTEPNNISSGGSLENGEIVWTIGRLSPGQSVPVRWQATVDPDIPLGQSNLVNTTSACDGSGSCDTALASTRVLKPAVSLIKNATSHVYPHGLIDYELTLQNSGETALTQIVVRDPLPAYVLNPSQISSGGLADPSPFEGKIDIVWNLSDLAPGEAVSLTWQGTVDPFIPDSEFAIRNVATVTSKEVSGQAEASSYVLHPRLLLRKSATVMAGPGETVQYSLTVENHSWAPAYGVEVHDPIPAYILNAGSPTEGGEVRAEEILWRFGLLNPGESRSLSWAGTVDPAIPVTVRQIANTAIAFDGMGHQDEAEAYTNLPGQSLYAYKSASYIVWPGGDIDYTLTLQNLGQAALEQIEVRDPVPDQVLYPREINSGGVFEGNSDIVWRLEQLAPGQSVVLAWRGTLDPGLPRSQDILWNEARLTSAGGLEATVRAKSYVEFPRLDLYKISTPTQAGPGEAISYTLMVENPSGVPALNLVIRDPLPAQVIDPVQISDGGVLETMPQTQIVWRLPSLGPGERRLLSWQGSLSPVLPAAAAQIVNTATVEDLSGLRLQAQATTTVLKPGLALSKSAPAEVAAGQAVSYRLTLANTGQMRLRQVSVVDPLPAYVLDPAQISHGGLISGSQIIWALGDLLPGASLELTWQGRLDQALPPGLTTLENRAVASAWPGLEATALAESAVVQPDLLVVKHAPAGIRPGEIIDYRIEVINQGRVSAYGLTLSDPIPAYLSPYQIGEGGYEMPGGYLTWAEISELAPGQSRSFTWRAKVDPALPPEVTLIRNVAQVSGLGGLRAQGVVESAVLASGLLLSKEALTATYAGGEISYRLHLLNSGPGLARQVEVRDPVPGFVRYLPGSANAYGMYDDKLAELIWRFDQLGPGQAVELNWRGQVAVDIPAGVQALVNEATARSFDQPAPLTATAVTQLLEPLLTVQASCPEFSQPGERLRFEFKLENSGPGPLYNLTARAPMTPGLVYMSGSAADGDGLSWTLGTLAAGARAELAYELLVSPAPGAERVESSVSFTAAQGLVGESRCESLLAAPALQISKIAPPAAHAGDRVEYTLVVSSTGPVVARGTRLTDTLSAGVEYLPGTISDSGLVEAGTLIWDLGDLAPGQSVTRRFMAQLAIPPDFGDYDAQGRARIYNEAAAAAEGGTPVRAEATVLIPRPVLTLTRTALTGSAQGGGALYRVLTGSDSPRVLMARVGPDEAAPGVASTQTEVVPAIQVGPGDTISYTLSGGNTGPGLARQARLREWLPAGLIILEESISQGGYYDAAENAVVWPLGDLAEGQWVRRSYSALVPQGMRPGLVELADNLAFVSSPDASTVYASARTEITGTFRMAGSKTASTYSQAGGLIDYAIRVQNTSPNLLDQVVIRDPLPDYTSYVADSASLPPAFEDGGRSLVWNLGALAAGEVREVRFRVRVAARVPDVVGRITNKARISFAGGAMFEIQASTLLPPAQLQPTPAPGGGSSGGGGGGAGPTATAGPGRPPLVVLPSEPAITTPQSSPLPAPVLVKSVAPAVIKAGQTVTVTWRLVFTNPGPDLITGLTIRDVLPDGVVYVESSASQGRITAADTAARPGPTSSGGDTRPAAAVPQAAGVLAGRTEVMADVGQVPPGGRVEIIIGTRVLSASRELDYGNVASFSAATLEPGRSNEVRLVVEGSGAAILPVTGGWLDPRTPEGRFVWRGVALLLICLLIGWQWGRARWTKKVAGKG